MSHNEKKKEKREVIISDEVVLKHTDDVNCVLFISPKYLISGGEDKMIIIHDISNPKSPKKIQAFISIEMKGYVYTLIQTSENSFLSGDYGGFICGFSHNGKNNNFEKFLEIKMDNRVSGLLKLNKNNILVVCDDSDLQILNLDDQKIERYLNINNNKSGEWPFGLILSQNYRNQFYFARNWWRSDIVLFDFEKNKDIKIFNSHPRNIYCLELFHTCHTERNEEILIGGCEDEHLYFYNTKNSDKLIKKVRTKFIPYCFSFLNNKYLMVGEYGGYSEIFDISKEIKIQKILEKEKYHKYGIFSIDSTPISFNQVLLFSGSVDGTVKICTLTFNSDGSFFGKYVKSCVGYEHYEHSISIINSALKKVLEGANSMSSFVEQYFDKKILKMKFDECLRECARSTDPFTTLHTWHIACVAYIEEKMSEESVLETKKEFQESFKNHWSVEYSDNIMVYEGNLYFGEFNKYYEPNGLGVTFTKSPGGFFSVLFDDEYTLSYFGSFKQGKKEGKGREFEYCKTKYRSGIVQVFEGKFHNGKRHGRGEELNPKNGEIVQGEWKDGLLLRKSQFRCLVIPIEIVQPHLRNDAIAGSGGFGNVYKVNSSTFEAFFNVHNIFIKDPFVAVKTVKWKNTLEEEYLRRMILRGIKLCQEMKNERILPIYAMFEGIGEIGYIMKYCPMSLEDVLKKLDVEMKEKTRYLRDVATVMSKLHQKKIVHRDLKPGNVMVSNEGEIWIADIDTLKEDETSFRHEIRYGTSNIGSTGFVAPESYLDSIYSLKSDVYSFSMMMYSLLFNTNRPYSTQVTYQCSCGVEFDRILNSNHLDKHVAECTVRPALLQSFIDKNNVPKYLLDLMISCWDPLDSARPSFDDIVKIFASEVKNERSYSIIRFTFLNTTQLREFRYLLMEPKIEKLREIVCQKYAELEVEHFEDESGMSLVEDSDVVRSLEIHESLVISVRVKEESLNNVSSESNKDYKAENTRLREEIERLRLENQKLKARLMKKEGNMEGTEIADSESEVEEEGED